MKKKLVLLKTIGLWMLLIPINYINAQQLLTSFIEQNSIGNTGFGSSVSSAGDVNNDGYEDIVVGAYEYSNRTGRAYIYFGGNSMDNVADVIMTGETYSYFGIAISGAGDVNNDGYDDIVVGTSNYSTGRAYIYFGGSSMDNIPDVIMTGEGDDNGFGNSVSGIGDVNGDEFDDVIIGAQQYPSNIGKTVIYFGGSNMDNIADVIMTGENSHDWFGKQLSRAGDVNNDGYDDAIIGATDYSSWTGRVYIYLGGSVMDNLADVIMTGENTENYFGNSISSAGDVNNDGYDDIIVGEPNYSEGIGKVYIFFGGNIMDNTADFIITGDNSKHNLGNNASSAGDINNDGFDDVIVGATINESSNSIMYIYYGGNIMDENPDYVLTKGDNEEWNVHFSNAGDVNNDGFDDLIAGMFFKANDQTGAAFIYYGGPIWDSIEDVNMRGEGTNNEFGYSVSDAGDVNGDGYDDVIIGTPFYAEHTGRAYLYYGGGSIDNSVDLTFTGTAVYNNFGVSVSGAGDVNNDGFDDVIISDDNLGWGSACIYYGGINVDNNADVIITNVEFGFGSRNPVSGAGDVNGDGFDDIIIGATTSDIWESGKAFIFFGATNMDNIADLILVSEGTEDHFGFSVSGAGDVNNDGFDDIIVGADYENSDKGRVYIYYGGSEMNKVADVIITEDGLDYYFGYSVSSAGDVNKDGFDDVIIGAKNYTDNMNKAYIYYGSTNMDNNADVSISSEVPDLDWGISVSNAGDVNNDGYDDVIVGNHGCLNNTGVTNLHYGGSNMDNITDIQIIGEGEMNNLGCSVSGAGDVNNDGYNDFVIGASSYPVNGKVYLYCDSSAPVNVETTLDNYPNYFDLFQNYPNPFNPVTKIKYSIPETAIVKLIVYDILGNQIAVLRNEVKQSGTYEVNFDGTRLPSGVYICNLTAGRFSKSIKILLVK